MSQHTPGPWAYASGEDARVYLINGPKNHAVGEIVYADARNPADARLISAAPDLLDALRALMALDVKGHALADRLQFSDAGRAILDQCQQALKGAQP